MTSPSPAASSSPRSPRSRSPRATAATPEETTPLPEPTLSNPLLEETPPSPLLLPSSSDDAPSWDGPDESPTTTSPDGDEGSGSRPRSTGRAAARRAAREVVDTFLGIVTTLAHQLLTRDGSAEREGGLFLPDEEDLEAIADPAAGIMSRRAPAAAGNPDVTDGIRIAFGLGGYVLKQRAKMAAVATERAFTGQTGEEPGDDAFAPQSAATAP